MVDRCQSPRNWVSILIDVDEGPLAKIEALAWELVESRQNPLRRFIEKGLKRERRRLSRGRRTVSPAHTGSGQVGAHTAASGANGREPPSQTRRQHSRPSFPREVA